MLLNHWLASWYRRGMSSCSLQGIGKRARRDMGNRLARVETLEERALLTNIDLANLGAAGTTIYGIDPDDRAGFSVSSAGDMNGDGFDDVVIGTYDADGAGNLVDGCGECYILFGSSNPPATVDLANLGSAGVTIYGDDLFDKVGESVSRAGDVNGDGFDDIIIGADRAQGLTPQENVAGRSYVIFGGASLPTSITISALGNAGITIIGKDNGDHGGRSVSGAGDINGDGFDDLLVGANSSDGDGNATNYAGETYILFGNAAPAATIELANPGSQVVTIFGIDDHDQSGRPVSRAGDINNDGFDDILIGAPYGDGIGNASANAGEAYLIWGGPTMPSTINLNNLGSAGVTIYGIDAHDYNGVSVGAAGDLNGDGFDDFAVGAIGADGPNGNKNSAGEVYVIFGGSTLDPVIDLTNLGSDGMTIFGADNLDLTGASVTSVGDIDGDGYDDLLIGASRSSSLNNQRDGAGESHLIFGSPNLPATIDLTNLGANGFTVYGADGNDRSGWSVNGAGDVNGDGFKDLIIGAIYGGGIDNAKPKAGESYIIYGGNITSTVTLPGTPASETLTGSADADKMVGGSGNDVLLGNGGADVVYGGPGDDILALTSLDFLRLDGGNGTDTVRLDGSGLNLDLTTLSDNQLENIEAFDIRGSGANSLTVNLQEIFSLTNNSNSQHTANTLRVLRDADDTVNMGPGWAQGNDALIDGVFYSIYTQGAATLQVGIPGAPGLLLNGPDVTWVKKEPPVIVLPQITASGDNIGGGTLTISVDVVATRKKVLDQVSLPSVGALGTSTGPHISNGHLTLQVQLAQNVTPADLQAFLRAITFSSKGKGLRTPTRTVQVTLTDASNLTIGVTQTIHVRKKQ